jgi:hypothetical protein
MTTVFISLFQQPNNAYQVNNTKQHCSNFPKKLVINLVGIESGSAVPQADAISTAPRRQGSCYIMLQVLG